MSESSEGSGSSNGLLDLLPTDKLTEVAETLLKTMASKAVDAAIDQIENLTGRLTEVAENGGQGLSSVLGGGDGSNAVTDTLKSGMSTLTSGVGDKVKGALGMSTDSGTQSSDGSGGSGGGGGRGKFKFMNIFEVQDVGVPRRVVYDQWTQFADFPSFMKKVETVDQESDEKVNWKAQVFWSHRSWETTIIEQVADSHIIWTSTGAKGHADGHVSFHELGPNLTRIILVLEYYPQGFMEKTGNLWRAVGRRTRLEFKHFCRHVMMDTLLNQDELEGWRGEIRDREVVKTHEEALQEEQQEQEPEDEDLEDSPEAEDTDAEDTDAEDTDAEDEDDEEDEDTSESDEDTFEDEDQEPSEVEAADEGSRDQEEAADEEEPDEEPAPRRSRRPRRRQGARS